MDQQEREYTHLSMIVDISLVIRKYFPDCKISDIEKTTMGFLTLFVEETIHQLGKGKN